MSRPTRRRRRPLETITFRLSKSNFKYLEGLTNTAMLKDVLCLYHPIKTVDFKPDRRRGHKGGYRVSLTIYGSDKVIMDYTIDHSYPKYRGYPNGWGKWDSATLEDKYSLLVGDLIIVYAESLEPPRPLSKGLLEKIRDYRFKKAEAEIERRLGGAYG